jgi:hypothetical protein
MDTPSTFKLIRKTTVLTRVLTSFVFRVVENVPWRRWNSPQFCCTSWTPEAGWACKNNSPMNSLCNLSVTPHTDTLLKKLCETETSTFRKSKNLFCKVIRRLVHKVVRFPIFSFFWTIYPDFPVGKHCTRVKLLLCYFSLCTVLLLWISRFTEWEKFAKVIAHHISNLLYDDFFLTFINFETCRFNSDLCFLPVCGSCFGVTRTPRVSSARVVSL